MKVYLSGEIHSNWRDAIENGCRERSLEIQFLKPETVHEMSDDVGDVLGAEENSFWKDHKSAKINSIRISKGIRNADLVVVKFGEKYRQWNAAFDAGYAAALGKSLVIMHGADHQHALKEVDAAALAVVETPQQVVEILTYVLRGDLPER